MDNVRECGALVAGDFCKKCRFFDPVVRKHELFSGCEHVMTETEFYCNHVEVCKNLLKLIENGGSDG